MKKHKVKSNNTLKLASREANFCELCPPPAYQPNQKGLDIIIQRDGAYEDSDDNLEMFLCNKHSLHLAKTILKKLQGKLNGLQKNNESTN